MSFKKVLILFYILFIQIIITFLIMGYFFREEIKIPIIENLFAEQNLSVVSHIVFFEGNEIFYSLKNKPNIPIKHNTQITKNMTIQTGDNSTLCFYIKDHGYYYLYPNTVIYINKIDYFTKSKSTKETLIVVEKGQIFADLNFFSKNSYLIIETSNLYSTTYKAKFLINKIDDFQTDLYCLDGDIYFRPFSNKFIFYRNKRIYDITSSIERLINTSNVLKKDQWTTIKYSMSAKLDELLTKIYESNFLKTIDKEYITSNIIIPKYYFDPTPPPFYIPDISYYHGSFNNYGYVDIKTPSLSSDIYFLNKKLSQNNRYLNLIESGKYQITHNLPFTNLIYNFNVGNLDYNYFNLKSFAGLNKIYLNGVSSNFNIVDIVDYNVILVANNTEPRSNYQLIKINRTDDVVKNINIETDLEINNVYYLSEIKSFKNINSYLSYEQNYYEIIQLRKNINSKFVNISPYTDIRVGENIILLLEYFENYNL